jgi:hypothetical protein
MMAQAPSPTTIPMSNGEPPVVGAARVTLGVRQGWKMPDGSILYDDGEKEVPASGKSDAEKRAEALKVALGETTGPVQPGASKAAIAEARTEIARLSMGLDINEKRQKRAKEVSALEPAATRDEARARLAEEVPSAEQQQVYLRQTVRGLVNDEALRIEELKQLAMQGGIVLTRDGLPRKKGVQELHDHLIEALNCAERGDTAKAAAALAELKRWSLTGDLDVQAEDALRA